MKFLILFFFIFKKIYSIPGTDDEGYNEASVEYEVDLRNVCPCDKTEGVCDFGCCCDKDCLIFMLDQNYYSLFSECDSSSSFKMTIDSKLDYCDGHKKSVDDLYNPLTLAFKILKKGFCKVKKQKEDIIFDNIPINNEEINNNNNDLNDTLFGKNEIINNADFIFDISNDNFDNFEKMNYNVPISLPSGICLFGYYQIMKLQDYEVTCSYNVNKRENIIEYYNNNNVNNFYIYNDYFYNITPAENNILKKIEIIYFNDSHTYQINHYYKVNLDNDENNLQDLTFIVKFLKVETDYPRSGNPGYIKGNPILIRKKQNIDTESDNYYIYTILPKEKENNCDNNVNSQTLNLYFDNYFDNKLTFEDFIIYGYKSNNKECFKNIYDNNINNINNDLNFGKFGSANIRYDKDWKEIKYNEDNINVNLFNFNLIYGTYKPVGTVNIFYFISKFEKLKIETEWWYAYAPGFIRLPKNIMYPFRIGTTRYSQ